MLIFLFVLVKALGSPDHSPIFLDSNDITQNAKKLLASGAT